MLNYYLSAICLLLTVINVHGQKGDVDVEEEAPNGIRDPNPCEGGCYFDHKLVKGRRIG